MTSELQASVIAIAIGATLTLVGFYLFHRIGPPKPVRALLGVVMLLACGLLIYPLMSAGDLLLHPVRVGLSIALFGVGINQVTALLLPTTLRQAP